MSSSALPNVPIPPGPSPESEEDAIIRVTTYHRRDLDVKVINFPPERHSSIKGSHLAPTMVVPFKDPNEISTSRLGTLQVLPTEILADTIFLHFLPLQSLFRLLHTSTRARELVTGLPQWRAVATHAQTALLSLFRTGAATQITLAQLYAALKQKWCSGCGKYGGFLVIPHMARWCIKCVYDPTRNTMIDLNSVAKYSKLSLKSLRERLAVVHTLPGYFGRRETKFVTRTSYVSYTAALDVIPQLQRRRGAKKGDEKMLQAFISHATAQIAKRGPQQEIKCRCTTVIPHFDTARVEAYWGLSCKGCARREMSKLGGAGPLSQLPERVDRAYSREGFLEHFRGCKAARRLWRGSKGGTKNVSGQESRFSRMGGFRLLREVGKTRHRYIGW